MGKLRREAAPAREFKLIFLKRDRTLEVASLAMKFPVVYI